MADEVGRHARQVVGQIVLGIRHRRLLLESQTGTSLNVLAIYGCLYYRTYRLVSVLDSSLLLITHELFLNRNSSDRAISLSAILHFDFWTPNSGSALKWNRGKRRNGRILRATACRKFFAALFCMR